MQKPEPGCTCRSPFEWKRVGEDRLDPVIANVVTDLHVGMLLNEGDPDGSGDMRPQVIVMSGRDEACRAETEQWLVDNGIQYDHLFMRPEGDMRKDSIVKAELFDEHIRDNFDVKFVLDDRQQVVDMWRSMGITCLQVAEGNF